MDLLLESAVGGKRHAMKRSGPSCPAGRTANGQSTIYRTVYTHTRTRRTSIHVRIPIAMNYRY